MLKFKYQISQHNEERSNGESKNIYQEYVLSRKGFL
jgi:hypothetical protein